MQIIDSNKIDPKIIKTDVCVIGAGPAGITLAAKLAGTNLDVVVADSGGRKFDEKPNELNKLKVHSNFTYRSRESKRNRQIGGTANLWVGRIVPYTFDPVFDEEWGDLKEAVLPFYDDAFRVFGLNPEVQNIHGNASDELYAYWAENTQRFNSGSKILSKNKNSQIFEYLTCIGEPEFDEDRIRQLTFVNQKKERISIQARSFIFAMGAIENTRMLLVMREQMDEARYFQSENMGKYMMDHPRIWHGLVSTQSEKPEITRYQIKAAKNGFYKIGIRNHPVNTRVYSNLMKDLNRISVLINQIPLKSYQVSSKKLLFREKGFLRTAATEIARLPIIKHIDSYKNLATAFFNRDNFRDFRIMTYCEQRPRIENKMSLDIAVDRNNLKIPELKNNIHEDERSEVVAFYEKLKKIVRSMGATLDYDPEFLRNSAHYTDASHMMGGTRYSSDKEKTVLEKDLSVLGISNLHITGSSVFPTSGVENPTHLIVCLSCYLADVLKRKLK